MSRKKIYELYPSRSGFSCNSKEYDGKFILVAAVSVKQAYYFAGNNIWAKNPNDPEGIVDVYNRNDDCTHTLWCGCRNNEGSSLLNNDGVRQIKFVMKKHMELSHRGGK